MAYRFELDSANRILRARFDGQVTDELFLEFYRVAVPAVVAATEYRASIVDFTHVTSFELTPETLRALAWSPPADPNSSRARVIVATTPGTFGLARMFAAYGENTRPNLHIVRSLEEAYEVLGVTECNFEPLAEPTSDIGRPS